MTQALTLAEALRADEERFAVARDVLLAEYRRLCVKRPDVQLPVGGPGARESGLLVCPQTMESWHETLEGEDLILLGQVAERLGFTKEYIRLHAIAVARYRLMRKKIEALGDVDQKLKAAEAAKVAAWPPFLEAQKAVGRAAEEYDQALLRWRKWLGLDGDILVLRQSFEEILPEE